MIKNIQICIGSFKVYIDSTAKCVASDGTNYVYGLINGIEVLQLKKGEFKLKYNDKYKCKFTESMTYSYDLMEVKKND